MRRGTALLVALALTGCAVGPPLEARLAAWIGRSESDLVTAFGVPTRTYEVDGLKFLQYEDRRAQLVPYDPFWGPRPYGRFGPLWSPPPPAYVVRECAVTFALRQGMIESFSFRGDGCA